MNWYRQNRFLGTFLLVFGIATLGSLYFIWSAKSGFDEAKARFDQNAMEFNRLQRLVPFPTEVNLRKMKAQGEDYAAELNKLKEDLKTRVLPAVPIAPNEFQSRLRQAMTSLGDKARANRVKLPDNFYLGFDEFAAALPETTAAPALGQQLAQVELLMNVLIDARVDAVTSVRRIPATESLAPAAATTPSPIRSPAAAAKPAPSLVERSSIDASFVGSPAAVRRVLNQISTAPQQFYIIRTLHIRNEKDVGPPRAAAGGTPAAVPPAPGQPGNAALQFIVGNERVQMSARIEMVRFAF